MAKTAPRPVYFLLLLISIPILALFSVWLWNRFDEPLSENSKAWLEHRPLSSGPSETFALLMGIGVSCPKSNSDCWVKAGHEWFQKAMSLSHDERQKFIAETSKEYDFSNRNRHVENLNVCERSATFFCPSKAYEHGQEYLLLYRNDLERYWRIVLSGPYVNQLPAESLGDPEFPSSHMFALGHWALYQVSQKPYDKQLSEKFSKMFQFWQSVLEQPGTLLTQSMSLLMLKRMLEFASFQSKSDPKFKLALKRLPDTAFLKSFDLKHKFEDSLHHEFGMLAPTIQQAHPTLDFLAGSIFDSLLGLFSFKRNMTINLLQQQYEKDLRSPCLADVSACRNETEAPASFRLPWWQYLDNGYGRKMVLIFSNYALEARFASQSKVLFQARKLAKELKGDRS